MAALKVVENLTVGKMKNYNLAFNLKKRDISARTDKAEFGKLLVNHLLA